VQNFTIIVVAYKIIKIIKLLSGPPLAHVSYIFASDNTNSKLLSYFQNIYPFFTYET
jgi:hypothetical protein